MPSRSPQKKPKSPPPKLNLEEMEHDPSLKGMLSFLEISPADRLELIRKRAEVDVIGGVLPFPSQPEFSEQSRDNEDKEGLPEQPKSMVNAGSESTVYVDTKSTVYVELKSTADAESAGTVDDNSTSTVFAALERTVLADPRGTVLHEPTRTDLSHATGCVGGPADTPSFAPDERTDLHQTVPVEKKGTVLLGPAGTVPANTKSTVPAGLWQAEANGGLFPTSRVRRIVLAQDALTHVEESVYDVLWGPKNQNKDAYRLVSMGYETIAKAARVRKVNARLIIERLTYKGFLKIEELPDLLRRIPTKYRVFSYRAVLDNLIAKNRNYVVRTGNGVLFVHPFDPKSMVPADSMGTVLVGSERTVHDDPRRTVPAHQADTVSAGQQRTVPPDQSSTVLAASTPLGNSSKASSLDTASSRWPESVRALLEATAGQGDDDAVERMATAATTNAPDATDEELAHFIRSEAPRVFSNRTLDNPIGMLIRQVPRRFVGESFRLYREAKQRERSALDEANREYARNILSDSSSTAEDRVWAEGILSNATGEN